MNEKIDTQKIEPLEPTIETKTEKIEKAALKGDRLAQSIKVVRETLIQGIESIYDENIESKSIPEIMREMRRSMMSYHQAMHEIRREIMERKRGNKHSR